MEYELYYPKRNELFSQNEKEHKENLFISLDVANLCSKLGFEGAVA